MLVRASSGNSGGGKSYVQYGITSDVISCGFQASKVYLSDPNFNTSHLLALTYDYAIDSGNYIQLYDGGLTTISNSGAYPFIMALGTTSVTISSSYVALLSPNAVIMVCE